MCIRDRDVTLSDLVADQRALTPSEAGELVVPDRQELAGWLMGLYRQLTGSVSGRINSARMALDALASRPVLKRPQEHIYQATRECDEWGERARRAVIDRFSDSRQEMEKQGMSIEEIKGADPSENGVQDSRNKPISDWSEKDYLKATSPIFHDAIRNPSVGTSRSYLPKVTITPGDETNVEQRTAPISTWGVQDYLKVAPQNKHQAIKEMQKSPIVTPGETSNVEPRTKPISEFTKEEYLNISPPNLHDAINNQGGTFTVGNNRSYDDITITIATDTYYYESSWNLYDSSAGAFYYAANQTFASAGEEQVVNLSLQPGVYSVVAFDSYGDGGLTGTVTDEDGIVLVAIAGTGSESSFDFTVAPPTSDVTISLATDYFYTESSWQLFTAAGVAVNTLQTYTAPYAVSYTHLTLPTILLV